MTAAQHNHQLEATALSLLALLALASPARADDMDWFLAALYAAKTADLVTTEIALHAIRPDGRNFNMVEGNPLAKHAVARYGLTAIAPYVVFRAGELIESKARRAIAYAAVTAGWSYLAYHNYSLYRRKMDAAWRFHVEYSVRF